MALPKPEWCDTRQNTGDNMPYVVYCMRKVHKAMPLTNNYWCKIHLWFRYVGGFV